MPFFQLCQPVFHVLYVPVVSVTLGVHRVLLQSAFRSWSVLEMPQSSETSCVEDVGMSARLSPLEMGSHHASLLFPVSEFDPEVAE